MRARLESSEHARASAHERAEELEGAVAELQSALRASEARFADLDAQASALAEREYQLMREHNTVRSRLDLTELEKARLQRELESAQEQLGEVSEESQRAQQDRAALEVELRQAQEASTLLAGHLGRVKDDKNKLRGKLRDTRTDTLHQ